MINISFFQQYFKIRSQAIEALKGSSEPPYPHKFHVSISLKEFIEKYNNIEIGQWLDNETVTISGEWNLLRYLYTFFKNLCCNQATVQTLKPSKDVSISSLVIYLSIAYFGCTWLCLYDQNSCLTCFSGKYKINIIYILLVKSM